MIKKIPTPTSPEQALERRSELTQKRIEISSKLATMKEDHRHYSEEEYHSWRAKAIIALSYVDRELSIIKNYLRKDAELRKEPELELRKNLRITRLALADVIQDAKEGKLYPGTVNEVAEYYLDCVRADLLQGEVT